ncbi:MAG TPA: tetratricopeptide repeat protein, partial [Rhizomicrobium sp.]
MNPDQLRTLAADASKSGNLAEAERLYRHLASLSPAPEVLVNLGNVLARQRRLDEALCFYDQALAMRPEFLEGWFNRGNLMLEMKRPDAALDSYDRVLALRRDLASVWNNRGTALRGLQRLEQALASFEQAAALDPRHLNAMTNQAIVLRDLKRLPEALVIVERVLVAKSDFAEALYVRANLLRDLGRTAEALADYERTLAAQPGHLYALNGVAQMALALCDWDRVQALLPRLTQDIQAARSLIQPFVMLGYTGDAALLRRCAENYVRRIAPPQPPLAARRYGHDRIRLAYLSADFHQHPTAQLMAELFERHDRNRFEVIALAFGPDDRSAMRARLEKAFDRFIDARGKSDREAAALLREMEIDIAVDLNGHTQDARPGILAFRPAPVQVNYLVYPGTTGAPYIDYVLADPAVLPMDQQPFFREKIVHLPDCYQANDATRGVGPAPSREAAGLPEQGFVFCCFNNGWKIARPVFDIWMRLLAQVEDSVLWLLDGPYASALRTAAQARGADPARLVFAPKLPPDAHLARHRLADLFLDTLPYNAHTTASDALWAGVPLVTCYGQSFAGRVAASLLKAIDLPEL